MKDIRQEGSVDEYQSEFEKVRAQARCSEGHALSMFLGGLKLKIQKLVKTHDPNSVLGAYNLAKLFEEALETDYDLSLTSQPQSSSQAFQRTTYQPSFYQNSYSRNYDPGRGISQTQNNEFKSKKNP